MADRDDRIERDRDAPTGVDTADLDALDPDGPSDHAGYTEKKLDEGGFDYLTDKFGDAKEAVQGVGDGGSDAPSHLLGPAGGGMVGTGQDHSGGDGGSSSSSDAWKAPSDKGDAYMMVAHTKGMMKDMGKQEDPTRVEAGDGRTIDTATGKVVPDEHAFAGDRGDIDPPEFGEEPGDGTTIDVKTGERGVDEGHIRTTRGDTDPDLGDEPEVPLTQLQADALHLAAHGGGAAGPIDEPPDEPVGDGADPDGGDIGPVGPDTPYAELEAPGDLGDVGLDVELAAGLEDKIDDALETFD